MTHIANKLKGQGQLTATSQDAAIFGSAASLAQLLQFNLTKFRIGLWPIQCQTEPEVAMGLVVVLSYLLERWPSVNIYRLLARLEGDPQTYEWTTAKSQFSVDDWELEGLDENIAIWGNLEWGNDLWKLTLQIENDLAEAGDDLREFTYAAQDYCELLTLLIKAADDIMAYLEAGDPNPLHIVYTVNHKDNANLERLLKESFHWELRLFLFLWGQHQSEEKWLLAHANLINAGEAFDDNLGAWIVANSIAQALRPLYEPVYEILLPAVEDITEKFENSDVTAILLGRALFRLGERLRAYDLLEINLEVNGNSAILWQALAELYWQGGEFGLAVNTFQRAIEIGVVSVPLYRRYADLMLLLDANNITLVPGMQRTSASGKDFVEDFSLINPQDKKQNLMAWEAVEAYRAALELKEDDTEVIYRLALQLLELDEAALWPIFEQLVELDTEGEQISSIVERFYNVADVAPGIAILETVVKRNPERADLRLAIASAYLLNEYYEEARAELEEARVLTKALQLRADIDRLMLSVENPDFEAELGNITDLINAGSEISAEDVEFLEAAVESAPHFADCYVLLAKAYLSWGETDDALDTLLEGQKNNSDNPDIIVLLAQILWDADEEELAFDYLKQGLTANPLYVPLLALTGRYLFENGQQEAAREFLIRAEAIEPRNPLLSEVRAFIARNVG